MLTCSFFLVVFRCIRSRLDVRRPVDGLVVNLVWPRAPGVQCRSLLQRPPCHHDQGDDQGDRFAEPGPADDPDREAAGAEPTHDASRPFHGWTVPIAPTVTAIQGRHREDGYNRIAVELDAAPGYRVGYQPTIVRDRSGLLVQLSGRAFLQPVLTPAQAHDDVSHTTTPTKPLTVSSPSLSARGQR